uniref:Uncharacterized protein n=1 Tax=Timema shepardi TaxID=629360 RepID=A0A7R9AT88_TIMSH|nr:unnamed protein product [Timema shepardi]
MTTGMTRSVGGGYGHACLGSGPHFLRELPELLSKETTFRSPLVLKGILFIILLANSTGYLTIPLLVLLKFVLFGFRVAPGFPNHRTCLLHQKLQMLNCCISRKITRQRLSKAGSVDIDELDSGEKTMIVSEC